MKNLLQALHKAMAEMADPKKNATNPAFRNRYADLGAVLESIEGPLQRHGLILTQQIHAEGGATMLVTTLWHAESGESMASSTPLQPEKNTAQGLGSAISYMRRYTIKALFCLSDVDDDGSEASRPARPASKPGPVTQAVAKATNGTVLSSPEIVGMMKEAKDIETLDKLAKEARHLPDAEKDEVRAIYMSMKKKMETQ